MKGTPKRKECTAVGLEKSATTRFSRTIESSIIVQVQEERITTEDPIPVEPPFVLISPFNNLAMSL